MSNIKFSQLPNLGNLTAATIVPVVADGTNYTVTAANLQAYTNTTAGNITAGYFLGNGSQLTGLPATYTNSNVTSLLAAFGSNTISTTGNVTTGYIFGNGSQLTGIPASYTNANATALLASFGSNTISTTGNVTSGNLTASGNVAGTYILGNGSLLTGLAGNYGNSNVTTLMAGFGSNTISTTGNVTAGNVNTGGNVSGNYILGNGSLLTGLAGNYGNPNVVTLMASFGSNTISTTGNITAGNLNTGGNVTGAFIKGSGSQLTGIVTSISAGTGISVNQSQGAVTITATNGGTYGDANVNTLLNAWGSNTLTTTGNVSAGNLAVTGANAQLRMAGSTSNKVNFGATGVGSPTVGSYSPGAKVVLYDNISNTSTGYAIGIDPNTMWFGTDQAGSNFEYFVGNVKKASIESDGTIKANNVTYTGTDGIAGQVLTTYGNGVTYFSTSGGAGGSSISNGSSNVDIATPGGNITMAVGGAIRFFIGPTTATMNNTLNFTQLISASNQRTSVTDSQMYSPIISCFQSGSVLGYMQTANYSVVQARATTGAVGRFIAIYDSPTYAGQLAYWSTTGTAQWRYVGTNTAV